MKNSFSIFVISLIIQLLFSIGISAQWINTNGPGGSFIQALVVSRNNLFAGTYSGGVFISTNNGNNWNAVNSGLPNSPVRNFAVIDTNLFVGTSDGIYLSTNNGVNWKSAGSGLLSKPILALAAFGANLYAGTAGGGISFSTNNGKGWTDISSNLPRIFINPFYNYPHVNAIAVIGSNLFIGTEGYGVFMSTNNGTSWTEINDGLPSIYVNSSRYVNSFAIVDKNLFIGTGNGGFFIWDKNNFRWNSVANVIKSTENMNKLVVDGKNIYAGTWGLYNNIFLSTNYGTNWTDLSSGFFQTPIRSLVVNNEFLFAGTENYVFRRPLSEIATSMELSESILYQNYPNPFNPTTTIRFSIPKLSFVILKIFDLLGREVTTLFNEEKKVGTYEIKFDGSLLSSGIYFYRLQAGNYSQTKKLMIIK